MTSLPVQRTTPLYDVHRRLHAPMGVEQGWQLPQSYVSLQAEVAAATEAVALADASANGKLLVEGAQAAALLEAELKVPALAVGAGAALTWGHLYRLRADLFFAGTSPGGEEALQVALAGAARARQLFVTVTDTTHGCAELRLIGPHSRALLNTLCGLNFDPAIFADTCACQSSLAKTTQLILRRDLGPLPAFHLIGASSLAHYLWQTLLQAGQSLGLQPIGQNALQILAQSS